MEINFWVFLVERSCLDPNLGRADRLGKHGSYVRDSFNGYTHLLEANSKRISLKENDR